MSESPDRLAALFDAVVDLAPEERSAYLAKTCGDDEQLRRQVERLLRNLDRAGNFLSQAEAVRSSGTQPLSPTADKPGDCIGRYKLLEQIGEGGCGVVYMAEQQEPVRRRVALKIIKLGMDTKSVIARFEAERQALALMDHPNIAKVHDAGATDSGRPHFVMELVRGKKITDYCDEKNLSTAQRLDLFVKVCQAIQHAHQKGVIHRDIKPSNILVTVNDGVAVPKVIDFGIAKATSGEQLTDKTVFTAFEQFIGTPAYMSPEQTELTSVDIDTRSDVYSLGVLLYELLTGKTPFDSKELLQAGLDEMRRTIREKEPPTPSTRVSTMSGDELTTTAKRRGLDPPKLISQLRGDLDWIVMKCLEKNRARRYETANGLARDIQRHLSNEPVTARPPSRWYEFQKSMRRHRLGFAATGAVMFALVLGLGISVWQSVEKARAYQRAVAAESQQSQLRRQADSAASDLKKALFASYFSHALSLIEQEKYMDAMPYLSRCLKADPGNQAAITRLVTLLIYHPWMVTTAVIDEEDPVIYARFSPDGKWILTVCKSSEPFVPDAGRLRSVPDGSARLRDALTGRQLIGPLKFPGTMRWAEISSNGLRVMVLAEEAGLARIWDTQTGRHLADLSHEGHLRDAEFSQDGTRVVTAHYLTARVWDTDSGRPLFELKHNGVVNTAEFSPDDRWILTGSSDNTARLWDAQTGQPLREFKHAQGVLAAKFSANGDRILTVSDDQTARVWDAQSGQPLTEPLPHGATLWTARFSPDGTQILTAPSASTLCVSDARNGQPLTEPLTHRPSLYRAHFSPDGTIIATVGRNDPVCLLWDVQPGPPHKRALPPNGWAADTVQFSPDSRKIITTSYAFDDRPARVSEFVGGELVVQPMRHNGLVVSAQFSPDSQRVVTASEDGSARVWDVQTAMPLTEPLKHSAAVRAAEFSPDGRQVLTASKDGTARVWDARSGLPLTAPLPHDAPVWTAHFSPDGRRIVTASEDSTARVWDAQSGLPLTGPLKHNAAVRRAEFSPDGKRIVTASRDRTARVWDAQTGLPVTEPLQHYSRVWTVQFSPDGKQILTASEEGLARIWQVDSGQLLGQPLRHTNFLASARFSLDGRRIVTACQDGTARVWDAESDMPLTEPLAHGSSVSTAEFSPDGKHVVTCGGRNAVVWDIAPSGSSCPEWLPHLAEAICGQAFNLQGGLEPTKAGELWRQIARELRQPPGDDDWAQLGRWLLAAPTERTISPFSKITAKDYVQRRLKAGFLEPLEPALRLTRGNKELWRRTFEAARTNRLALVQVDLVAEAVAAGNLSEAGRLYRQLLDLTRQAGLEAPTNWLTGVDIATTLNSYAWLLAVSDDPRVRDGPAAVVAAKRAVSAFDQPATFYFDTLAAAYAEAGRFDEAISTLKEALAIARDEDKTDMTARLKLYESKTPYREH